MRAFSDKKESGIEENGRFYITTAIPYVNAAPHIGHALEFVQTDVIKRFQILKGEQSFLTTGADENSLKNVKAAEDKDVTVEELCTTNARIFKEFSEKISLSFDSFIRSSSKKEHWPGVKKLWRLCDKNGDIYKKKYKGLYCVGCEAFYKENELEDGKCPEHKKEPEVVEEENYFFRLSKYEKKLKELIESGELEVLPKKRKNEVLSFIDQGLDDFSISRSVERAHGWGIPVPGDGSQIIYVWYDALSCYLTGIGWGRDEDTFEEWWPADMHVIGKGIIRFHAIYWPAMLLSAGLPLPKRVFVHGYVTVEGEKMSKSLGNVVDPLFLIEKYGTDPVRYYLINEIPTFDDGDFSEARLVEKTNNELIGNFGNFAFRVLSFLKANFNSTVPEPDSFSKKDKKMIKDMEKAKKKISKYMEDFKLREAFQAALELASAGNKYFQSKKPWKTLREDHADCANTMYISSNLVRSLAIIFWPFIPSTCENLWEQLNLKGNVSEYSFKNIEKMRLNSGHRIGEIETLFERLEM